MSHNLEKYDKLVTALLVIVIFVLGIGWWFAEEKSEPVYLTKIDKLMFDKDNKAPKFVLTLPDKLVSTDKTDKKEKDFPKPVEKEEVFSLDVLLSKKLPQSFTLFLQAPLGISHNYI